MYLWQDFTSPFYGNSANCEILEKDKVEAFLHWLHENKLEPKKMNFETLVFEGLV